MANPFQHKPREWWLRKCLDLYFFCTFILASAWLDKFNDFGILHKKLCMFLMLNIRPSRRKLISVFRGSYKTTVLLGYCLWLFCWHIYKRRPITICYNTATRENAENFSDDFRETLKECDFLHDIFPMVPADPNAYTKWTKYQVRYRWVKFVVASLDTRQVSRHQTVIINDDLVNDDNAYSEKERETVKRKWKYQKSILTKYRKKKVGLEIDTGTPFHAKDLMSKLMKENKTYDKFIVPYAITNTGKVANLYKRNGYLTFPEMYTWEDFEEKRDDQGKNIFATQYELKVMEEAEVLCQESWLRYWNFLPENYYRIEVVDPAGTEEKTNDATGITIVDWDEAGKMHVIYAEEFYFTPMKLIRKMDELRTEFNPDETYVEKEKYSITIADTIEHLAPKLNFSFVEPKNRPKGTRIDRLKQWLENGRVLLGQGMMDLENQLLEYPDCESKAILDSLAYQLDVMHLPSRRISRVAEPVIDPTFGDELDKYLKKIKPEEGIYDHYF